MPAHSVSEAVDAVWTGACERHEGASPAECGAEADYRDYLASYEGIETWYC